MNFPLETPAFWTSFRILKFRTVMRINMCCYKPLSLWKFAIAVVEAKSDTTERLNWTELNWTPGLVNKGFPGGSDSEEYACNAGDPGSILGLGRSLGKGNGNPSSPVFLPGEFHGQRSLESQRIYSPWSHKGSDMTERLTLSHFHKPLAVEICFNSNRG